MKTKAIIENGFKETEIGLIPKDWQVKGFEECIDKERISRDIKIPQGKYKKVGRYPIVDQGASFFAGYTDDKSKLYSGCLPVIVFGDHTRIFKFVDFSFSLGADGIKLIQPKDFLNPKYFYYYLCSLTIENKGYNRHYKYLKEKFIAFPEKPEQQKIAFVLSKIQQVIEQQDKIIKTTKELKKSLMNKLLTEGLHGEEQKETEIGLMPKSWRIVELEDICRPKKEIVIPEGKGKYIYVGLEHMETGEIWLKSHGYDNEVRSAKFKFNESDVLYGKLRPYLDKAALPNLSGICSTDIIVLTPNSKIAQHLLIYILHLNNFIEYAKATTSGTNHPRTSWNSLKRYKLALPSIKEQKEIANIILNVDKKIFQAKSKKQTLQDLFKTMLNQLMTGKIRVKDFDFEVN